MKLAELKVKTPDQLEELVKDLKKEAFNLRFQRVSGELEKLARVREVRKTIARAKTLLNEQKKGIKPAAKKAVKAEKTETKTKKAKKD